MVSLAFSACPKEYLLEILQQSLALRPYLAPAAGGECMCSMHCIFDAAAADAYLHLMLTSNRSA